MKNSIVNSFLFKIFVFFMFLYIIVRIDNRNTETQRLRDLSAKIKQIDEDLISQMDLDMNRNSAVLQPEPANPKCPSRYIFLDLGASNGDVSKRFVDGSSVFPKMQGCDISNAELFLFEANYIFTRDLLLLKKDLESNNKVKHVNVYPNTAAYIRDDTETLQLNGEHSSLFGKSKHSRKVKSIDITQFILENFSPADYVIVKMNVEGAEFEIIPKLFDSGAYVNIDHIFTKWHKFPSHLDFNIYDNLNRHAVNSMAKAGTNIPKYE